MKKITAFLILALIVFFCLSGCASNSEDTTSKMENDEQIVTHTPEEYIDMLKNYVPANCNVSADELIRRNYGSTKYTYHEENGKKYITLNINNDIVFAIFTVEYEITDMVGTTNYEIISGSMTNLITNTVTPLSVETTVEHLEMIYGI